MNPRLDKACKEVLKNTPFLVRILKECVPEYADCTLEEIDTYITGTRVGEQKSKIVGDSESIYGRHVDLRFDALCPEGTSYTRIILNLEVQNKYGQPYSLVTRGIFYGALLLAAQDGREFQKQEYEKIKKVYSIWICTDPTVAERNCINLYELHEVQKVGRMKQDRSAYDKLSVILINLGPKDEAEEGILRMLEVLFSRERPLEERLEILKEEYDIPVNKGLEKGVSEVCNLSIGYYLDGLRDGKAEGEAKGRLEGEAKGKLEGEAKGKHETLAANLRTVMENMNCSLKQAMDFLRVPEEERGYYVEVMG